MVGALYHLDESGLVCNFVSAGIVQQKLAGKYPRSEGSEEELSTTSDIKVQFRHFLAIETKKRADREVSALFASAQI